MAFRTHFHLLRSRSGATAVEFAMVLPVFLAFLIGIIELGTILLYSLTLTAGSDAGIEYLRTATIHRTAITKDQLRAAIVSGAPFDIDNANLKISLVPIKGADLNAVKVAYPVANRFELVSNGEYVLSIGYDWQTVLPTSKFLIPYAGNKPQLQSVQLALMAVRVTE